METPTCAPELGEPSIPDRVRYLNSSDNVTRRGARVGHGVSEDLNVSEYLNVYEKPLKETWKYMIG